MSEDKAKYAAHEVCNNCAHQRNSGECPLAEECIIASVETGNVFPLWQPKPRGKHESIGQEIGRLVDLKNEAYGDAFGKTEAMLEILYPHGIPPGQFHNVGLIVRILDKVCRIVVDAGAFGESPYADIGGYGVLAESKWRERKGADGDGE